MIKDCEETTALRSIAAVCVCLEQAGTENALPKQGDDIDGLVQNLLFLISRKRAWMDWMIDSYAKGKIRPRIRRVLWWALVQLFFLNGLPKPVTVDTACRFVKKHYSSSDAAFVNAILRRILREQEAGTLPEVSNAPDWVQAGLPALLWERWKKEFGKKQASELGRLLQQEAPLTCRLKAGHEHEGLPEFLQPVENCDWCHTWKMFQAVSKDSFIPLEQFYIQDPSTLLAVSMLNVKENECIADLCAAPGGKSLLILEQLKDTGHLACCDRSPERLQKVRQNLGERKNVTFRAEDAIHSTLENDRWDGVLLDVPCSNSGVIRRRPDARWTFSNEKFRELTALQEQIAERAFLLVKPGGRLVYSTCSIEKEEDESQVEKLLAGHPDFKLAEMRKLMPTAHHDGAFAASLVRTIE